MPPHPSVPAGQSRISSSSNSNGFGYAQFSKIFLLVLFLATGVRLAILNFLTRKRNAISTHQRERMQEKDTKVCQAASESEKDLRQDGVLQSKVQPPTFKPMYPWISPPQPLPGPYDSRLYPLPTLRRHSYDTSVIFPQEDTTVSYTRRVSTNSIPAHQAIMHGTITTSTQGWKRNQWVISGK